MKMKSNVITSTCILIAANLLTIFLALKENFAITTIVLIYWIQSIVIAAFQLVKIIRAKKVYSEYTKVPEKKEMKIKLIEIFLFYCFWFGLVYLWMVLDQLKVNNPLEFALLQMPIIALPVAAFAINHSISFMINKEDAYYKATTSKLIWYPLARIIPMNIIVMLFITYMGSNQTILIFFLGLKTIADVIMHVWEHTRTEEKELH